MVNDVSSWMRGVSSWLECCCCCLMCCCRVCSVSPAHCPLTNALAYLRANIVHSRTYIADSRTHIAQLRTYFAYTWNVSRPLTHVQPSLTSIHRHLTSVHCPLTSMQRPFTAVRRLLAIVPRALTTVFPFTYLLHRSFMKCTLPTCEFCVLRFCVPVGFVMWLLCCCVVLLCALACCCVLVCLRACVCWCVLVVVRYVFDWFVVSLSNREVSRINTRLAKTPQCKHDLSWRIAMVVKWEMTHKANILLMKKRQACPIGNSYESTHALQRKSNANIIGVDEEMLRLVHWQTDTRQHTRCKPFTNKHIDEEMQSFPVGNWHAWHNSWCTFLRMPMRNHWSW